MRRFEEFLEFNLRSIENLKVMQIPFLAKLLFFLALFSLSYLSRKYSRNKHIVRKAKRAKPVN